MRCSSGFLNVHLGRGSSSNYQSVGPQALGRQTSFGTRQCLMYYHRENASFWQWPKCCLCYATSASYAGLEQEVADQMLWPSFQPIALSSFVRQFVPLPPLKRRL